jgi:hypothetical protein
VIFNNNNDDGERENYGNENYEMCDIHFTCADVAEEITKALSAKMNLPFNTRIMIIIIIMTMYGDNNKKYALCKCVHVCLSSKDFPFLITNDE